MKSLWVNVRKINNFAAIIILLSAGCLPDRIFGTTPVEYSIDDAPPKHTDPKGKNEEGKNQHTKKNQKETPLNKPSDNLSIYFFRINESLAAAALYIEIDHRLLSFKKKYNKYSSMINLYAIITRKDGRRLMTIEDTITTAEYSRADLPVAKKLTTLYQKVIGAPRVITRLGFLY
jgi:hypothetical protein